MSRANSDLMDSLHGLLMGSLRDELRRSAERAALPREHEDYAPLNPQLIDKALKALKDNGIDAPASNKAVEDLAGTLKDLDLDEVARQRLN